MTAEFVQTSYPLTHGTMVAGQIANTLPAKCETGRLIAAVSGAPANLGYGLACRRTDFKVVQSGVARRQIGEIGSNVSNNTSITIKLEPGQPRPAAGSRIVIGTAANTISVVGATEGYTAGSNVTANAGTAVYLLDGGRTDFAGVAVRQTALSAHNDPIDSYKVGDLVEIGSEGDFVVQTSSAVEIGDGASVDLRTASDGVNYAKFSNAAADASNYIGIPGAVFMTAVTATAGGLAVLRLTKQAA